MYFIGIDLAWSLKNNSAAAAIEAKQGQGELIDYKKQLESDKDIIDFVAKVCKDGPAIVGIDAPLIVPNNTKQRPCEKAISQEFGRYNAGAHSSNRHLLKRRYGRIRGEELVEKLKIKGFIHNNPSIPRQAGTVRQIVEVFPHPATINLFKLDKIFKYKRGRIKDRQDALGKLQKHIANLRKAEPALHIQEQYFCNAEQLHGHTFKAHEDFLDAILCAYIVYHAWYWGEQVVEGDHGYKIYGDLKRGYILVPNYQL